ncbi:MAG: MBL fold metallo-hydrolase [Deltaproteobacteria bacterium]|nr:MBL fold metallo-hydrolase [Deltaproteobacteria bacterium]
MSIRFSLLASLFSLSLVASAGCGAPVNLTVKSYSSDATFAVGSYLLTGNQDAILVDGQFTKGDAEKVVAMVKESGKTLRAIFLTHAHPDHYLGLDVIASAFPGVPVQATPEVVAEFQAKGPAALASAKSNFGAANIAEKLATVTAVSDDKLVLEGEELRIVKLSDGESPSAAALYGSRQKLLVAGDLIYNRAYLWLAECKTDAWTQNLKNIRSLGPIEQIYPGHGAAPATAAIIDENLQYLATVPPIFQVAATAADAIAQVKQKYSYTGGGLLDYSTQIYFSACKKP